MDLNARGHRLNEPVMPRHSDLDLRWMDELIQGVKRFARRGRTAEAERQQLSKRRKSGVCAMRMHQQFHRVTYGGAIAIICNMQREIARK